jgi:hypothetical protein
MSSIQTKNERWTPVAPVTPVPAYRRTNSNSNNTSNAMPRRSSECSDHLRQILIEQDFRTADFMDIGSPNTGFSSSLHNVRRPFRKPSANNLMMTIASASAKSLDSSISSISSISSFGSIASISELQQSSLSSSNISARSRNKLLLWYTNNNVNMMTTQQDGSSMSSLCTSMTISSNHSDNNNTDNGNGNSRWKSQHTLSSTTKVHEKNLQRRWLATPSSENANGHDQPIGMIKRKSSTYLFPGAVSA